MQKNNIPFQGENSSRAQHDRPQSTRDRICKTTMEVIGRYGYRNANTTMIAKEAGVSRGALTHHFPTKLQLVGAAYKYLLIDWENKRLKLIQNSKKPLEIDGYVQFLWKEIFNHPQHVAMLELMLAARGDEKLREELNKSLNSLTLSRHELWKLVIGDKLQPDNNETLMLMTTCFLRGLSMQETIDPRPGFEEKVLELWADFLSHMGD